MPRKTAAQKAAEEAEKVAAEQAAAAEQEAADAAAKAAEQEAADKDGADADADGEDAETPEDESKPEEPKQIPGAPLDPPAEPAKNEEHTDPNIALGGTVGVELVKSSPTGSRLVIRTMAGYATPDADTLFAPITSSMLECKVRLLEETFTGPHSVPIRRLVLPAGQKVEAAKAEQILALVRAQAATE